MSPPRGVLVDPDGTCGPDRQDGLVEQPGS